MTKRNFIIGTITVLILFLTTLFITKRVSISFSLTDKTTTQQYNKYVGFVGDDAIPFSKWKTIRLNKERIEQQLEEYYVCKDMIDQEDYEWLLCLMDSSDTLLDMYLFTHIFEIIDYYSY